VIKGGPTGVFSLHINARTLHSILRLGIEKKTTAAYKKLGSRLCETLRGSYRGVDFFIIDEISMVSYEVLRMINLRILEIFGNPDPEAESMPFAGLNIIAFGDLFQLPACFGHQIYNFPTVFQA